MFMCVYVCVYLCECVCVCESVCVRVRARARAFVFISFHLRGFSQLNKTVNAVSEFGSATGCRGNISVQGPFFFVSVSEIYIKSLQASS